MTDREKKLTFLLATSPNLCLAKNCTYIGAAKDLIANGVTVQEWISVKDRLPEKDGLYLITACDEGCPYGEGIWYDTVVVLAEYFDDGRWVWYEGVTEYDLCDIVTHWFPLPQPPKGE